MSSSRWQGPFWLKRAVGAALILGGSASLGYQFWDSFREPSLETIRIAVATRRWDDVEAGLRRWLKRHPHDGDAWEMLGGLLFDQGRMDDALKALRHVRTVDKGWVHVQIVISDIAIRRRRLAEAEQTLRRAAERDSRAVEPLERLVSLLSLERRTAEARSVLRRLFEITRDPRHLADSILISQLELGVRDLTPDLEEFVKETPDDPWLRRVCGLLLLSRGRSAEALPHLEAAAMALEDDPLGRLGGVPDDARHPG
jgi:enediyne biosynthesis protein E4